MAEMVHERLKLENEASRAKTMSFWCIRGFFFLIQGTTQTTSFWSV